MRKRVFLVIAAALSFGAMSCSPDTFGSSQCDESKPCADSSKVCVGGVCVDGESCDESRPCADSTKVCVGGVCVADESCSATKPCADSSKVCVGGVCVGGESCSESKACEDSSKICVDGVCVDGEVLECSLEKPCTGEQDCVNGVCVDWDAPEPFTDEDGDGISDAFEGKDEGIDTDNDTVPDYLDLDSDGDTIPDSVEYGYEKAGYAPRDSDGDTIPDFRSLDSDDNEISDADECKLDASGKYPDYDGDGIFDCHDMDNDGDFVNDFSEMRGLTYIEGGAPVLDAEGNPISGADCNKDGKPDAFGSAENPWDCDGDTVPDYMDLDSDGDTIPDRVEGGSKDSDGDKIYDRYDLDSDNDTIPDSVEAGSDPTSPRDSDGDTIPDYLDLDSDNDGLPDKKEQEIGSDPTNPDTDGDGVTDLVEFAAGTKPNDPNDNPIKNGDFVFVVPFEEESSPKKGSLSFGTSVQIVDMYFAIDSSGSMGDEIGALRTSLPQIINDTRCKEVGGSCLEDKDCTVANSVCSVTSKKCIEDPLKKVGGCIADLATGFAFWGSCGSFNHKQSITTNASQTTAALGTWRSDDEGWYENPYEAAVCSATGKNANCPARKDACSSPDNCAGFRNSSIRIVAIMTDEGSETSSCSNSNFSAKNGTNVTEMGNRAGGIVKANNVKVVGFWNGISARNAITAIVNGSGTVDSNGSSAPFIIQAADAQVVQATKTAVMNIAKEVPLKITSEASDIDAGASQFIESLKINLVDQEVEGKTCTKVTNITSGKFEGVAQLRPGLSLCYDLKPIEMNTTVKAVNEPKVLKAKIAVKGDGSTLSERIVYFLIPPIFEDGGVN